MKIKLELFQEEVELVLDSLSKQPFALVNALFNKIAQQGREQIQAVPAKAPKEREQAQPSDPSIRGDGRRKRK